MQCLRIIQSLRPASNRSTYNSENPDIDEKCDYCGKCCPNTEKCSKCKKPVQYCTGTKDCESKHWQEHCKNHTAEKAGTGNVRCDSDKTCDQVPKCSHCEVTSPNLKKCTQCGKVQYCGKECQSQYWLVHKLECKKTKEDNLDFALGEGEFHGTGPVF